MADKHTIIEFSDLSFFYVNNDAPENIDEITPEDVSFIFQDLNLSLPAGVTSVIGENGIGKSTLMLLAAARLFPVAGKVSILGEDSEQFRQVVSDPALEAKRNAIASVVYQNMEFETEDSLGELLEQIFSAGLHGKNADWVIPESRKYLELDEVAGRKLQNLSKGEMQRALMAMAIAYGSAITFMDEPVFALEEGQKEKSLAFLRDYCHRTTKNLIFSAHNIHLCRDHADNTLLMRKDGNFVLGNSADVCSPKELEDAYRVPMDLLHKKESLYRDMLLKREGDSRN